MSARSAHFSGYSCQSVAEARDVWILKGHAQHQGVPPDVRATNSCIFWHVAESDVDRLTLIIIDHESTSSDVNIHHHTSTSSDLNTSLI